MEKLRGERVLTIKIDSDKRDITETNSAYDLIVELFPNHPNCYIIAYPYGKIVSLCHERIDLEKGILLSRNAEYSYPVERDILDENVRIWTRADGIFPMPVSDTSKAMSRRQGISRRL